MTWFADRASFFIKKFTPDVGCINYSHTIKRAEKRQKLSVGTVNVERVQFYCCYIRNAPHRISNHHSACKLCFSSCGKCYCLSHYQTRYSLAVHCALKPLRQNMQLAWLQGRRLKFACWMEKLSYTWNFFKGFTMLVFPLQLSNLCMCPKEDSSSKGHKVLRNIVAVMF